MLEASDPPPSKRRRRSNVDEPNAAADASETIQGVEERQQPEARPSTEMVVRGSNVSSRRSAKIKELKSRILDLQKRERDHTRELTQMKIALANSNHTLLQHNIQIPENAKMASAPPSEASDFSTTDRAPLLPSRSVAERGMDRDDTPFRFDQCGIPDTSNIVKNTRFGKNVLFPHCVTAYNATGEPFVPQVEARKRFVLRWRVVNRRRPDEPCDERNLRPGVYAPRVEFKILLVYADEPNKQVRLQDLNEMASHLKCLSSPNIIGQPISLQGGVVTFCISKLHVTSKMAGNRKFMFRLVCVDPDLQEIEEMHASSIPFYCVSRFRATDFDATQAQAQTQTQTLASSPSSTPNAAAASRAQR